MVSESGMQKLSLPSWLVAECEFGYGVWQKDGKR